MFSQPVLCSVVAGLYVPDAIHTLWLCYWWLAGPRLVWFCDVHGAPYWFTQSGRPSHQTV